jgi:type II secretory pathway predicted ATPase ExeA
VYYEYFNLKEHPFRLTSEPKYFYMTPSHVDAKNTLDFALNQGHALMLLTGGVGTGKSMMMEHVLDIIEFPVVIVRLNHTQLTTTEFLQLLALELGEESDVNNDRALLRAIEAKTAGLHAEGKRVVLAIDEAQNLKPELLRYLYELTQNKIDNNRVVSLLLVGQPELKELLLSDELRDIYHAIKARCHLDIFDLKQIKKYIYYRLTVAGNAKGIKFDDSVFSIIELYTGGRPRLINVLCDHILTYAFLEQYSQITPDIVDAAIDELQWLPYEVQYCDEVPKPEGLHQEERRNSYKLVITRNKKVKSEFFITSKRIMIGRHSTNELRLNDSLASRYHAQIVQQGRTTYLRDMNSTNGTFYRNKRIDIIPLEEGTTFRIGKSYLTYVRHNANEGGEAPPSLDESEEIIDFTATHHS